MAILYLNDTLKWNYRDIVGKVFKKIQVKQINEIGHGIKQVIFDSKDYEENQVLTAKINKLGQIYFVKNKYFKI